MVSGITHYYVCNYSLDPCLGNNGGCDQLCTISTFENYTCSCHPGFSLDLNGYNCSGIMIIWLPLIINCVDIDECANSDCEHICVNTIGSYSCLCHDGYSLDTNYRNCSGLLLPNIKCLHNLASIINFKVKQYDLYSCIL